MEKKDIKEEFQRGNLHRHEATALLRAFKMTAKERRRQVQEWVYEVNPPKTEDDIKKDYLKRRVSRKTAIIQLGKLNKNHPDTLFNMVVGWKAERNK